MATQLDNSVWVRLPKLMSSFDKMMRVTRQTGRQQVDCSKVEGRQ